MLCLSAFLDLWKRSSVRYRKMASFPVISNDGFFSFQEKCKFHSGKFKSLATHSRISYSLSNCSTSLSAPLLGLNYSFCKSRQRLLLCSTEVRSLINERRDVETHFRQRGSNEMRRRLSLRLRPRLRLLSRRLKRFSVRSALNNFGTFLRKNMRVTLSMSISIVLGICYLFLRLTAVPSPKVVPYSDLVTSLQSGYVTKVQFEEGTRRIYYNTNPGNLENTETAEDNISVPSESAAVNEASNEIVRSDRVGNNILNKMSRGRSSTPVWQFSTRKIDHDEGYLLSLMREKGTAYSSAPQSALMSMRSLLITVLSLWIPLTPLMWLLYRQLSAANSPAKKRRPANHSVNFSDVEGVDAAKVELMEVSLIVKIKDF